MSTARCLYVPRLAIHDALHNVIFAYTSNNSNGSPCAVYAFDADSPTASVPLWTFLLPNSAQWTTATPVIDLAAHTLYVLTKMGSDSGIQQLYAIDIQTGRRRTGQPRDYQRLGSRHRGCQCQRHRFV